MLATMNWSQKTLKSQAFQFYKSEPISDYLKQLLETLSEAQQSLEI